MENLKQLQKMEAIKRMKLLKIYPQAIREFSDEDLINKSEHGGILYWLEDDEKEMVKQFEQEHNALVYHVILNYTDDGKMYSLLFVSDIEDEWGYDIDDIKENRAFAYVINVDCPEFSEFGSIGIRPNVGGVVRTC